METKILLLISREPLMETKILLLISREPLMETKILLLIVAMLPLVIFYI